MVERYFEHPYTLRWMRTGATGAHMDAFATSLAARGYSRQSGRGHVRGAAHLGHWMEDNVRTLADTDEALLAEFFAHFPTCRCVRRNKGKFDVAYSGARAFLAWAREAGLARPAVGRQLPALIVEFEAWMVQHRNVSPASLRDCYRLQLLRFLAAAGDDPSKYDAAGIRRFILEQGRLTGPSRTRQAVTALRGLLRFLAIMGRCSPNLVHAPPSIARWRLASLPSFVGIDDIEKVIAACDPTTRFGLRDRAMVLLMSRIGLRAGDVTALKLSDLDWRAGTVVVSGKSRRGARMPLPQDVGDAILAWLERGRPNCDGDEVFTRVNAPVGPLDSSAAAAVAAAAIRRSGVKVPRTGSHVLRHSAATALLNEGMSLPAIGALLRHKSLDTTMIYAKVDVATLTTVARPWIAEVTS